MNKDKGAIALALALIKGASKVEAKGIHWSSPVAHPGGPVYRRMLDPDTGVWGWRRYDLALYYKALDGQVHAYQPGQDEARDKAFPALARKLGLRLLGRGERRALHREEKARYKAIVAKRGVEA